VSPNPVVNSVTINYNGTSHVKIYNLLGNEVISCSEVKPNGTLDVSALPSGMYLIKINYGSETATQKLLKN
ncbi:MAG: endonuclease I, partial [Candidatus Nephrothrix sp. EaCA]